MPKYAIYKENIFFPMWKSFKAPRPASISCLARLLRSLGFPNRYNAERADMEQNRIIDPAQRDIDYWCSEYGFSPEDFSGRPRRVAVPNSIYRVSEIYADRDIAALALDTTFNSEDARERRTYGAASVETVLSMESGTVWAWDIGAFIRNRFFIQEVPDE